MIRRRSLSGTLLCSVLFVGIGHAVEPSVDYRITGVVINSLTGAPVPRCHLSPSLTQQQRRAGRQFPAVTESFDADGQGRFSIPLPSAGVWHLMASAPGYVSQAYEQHENFSSAVVLTRSAPSINLVFRLPPEASIGGAVLDEAGEAVRNARVGLLTQQPSAPGKRTVPFQVRSFTQTDDRGVYEFANLPPGKYRILVEAKPWYANVSQQRRFPSPSNNQATPALDPSLDVTYQLTWYPGVNDVAQAETVALNAGDDKRADFHLVPIPAIHLQIVLPTPPDQGGNRSIPPFPTLERVDSGVPGIGFTQSAITNLAQGQIDVGGLAPGLYRVRIPEQNSEAKTAMVDVSSGRAQMVDFSGTSSGIVSVTMNVDGRDDDDRPFGIELVDAETGQRFFPMGGPPMPANMRRGRPSRQRQETIFQIPPGRYEVSFPGGGETYLTGISAQHAQVSGRLVTLSAGEAVLTLHTASGRATVTGIATGNGSPTVGALVLLVPAGLDDPGSIATTVRDQTNTDGSFELPNVIPGQYILIAVDHGWGVNWSDPSTLRNYLTQGIPLDISPNASLKQNINVQAP